MTSSSLPQTISIPFSITTVDGLLSDLREEATKATHEERNHIAYHLHNLLHQIDCPDTPPLETLIERIDTRLHTCDHLERVKRATALYGFLQYIKNPNNRPIFNNPIQAITPSPTLEPISTTSPPTSDTSDNLPPLEPYSPCPSPTPTAVDPIPSDDSESTTSRTTLITPYSDDFVVEVVDYSGPDQEEFNRLFNSVSRSPQFSDSITDILRHFLPIPVLPSLEPTTPTNTPTEDHPPSPHAI